MNSEIVRPIIFDKALEAHYRKNFDALVSKYSKRGSRQDGEDIVQEAYTRALERWEEYNPEYAFATWFETKVLPNEGINKERRERKHVNNSVMEFNVDTEDLVDSTLATKISNPEEVVYAKEILQLISDQHAEIREILHDVLVLGMSSDEVSKKVGRSSEGIRQIVSRFRKEIQHEDSVL